MLNDRIRQLRMESGISQVEMAKMLCVSKQSVSNWENDNIQPSIEMLVKIAKLFSVSTDFLLGQDNRTFIEVSGLTQTQIFHIQQKINLNKNTFKLRMLCN